MTMSFEGSALGNLLALLYFFIFQGAGIYVAVRLWGKEEKPLFALLMGSVFGSFLLHWSPILTAFFVGFSLLGHLLALLIPALLVFLSWKFLPKNFLSLKGKDWKGDALFYLVAGITLLYFVLTLSGHTIIPNDRGGLSAGQCTYGDMNLHLSIITHMPMAESFPVDYALLSGARLSYPFLCDSISSSLWIFGASLRFAYMLPMVFAALQCFVGLYLFAEEVLRDKKKSMLAWVMFFFCGGLGFFYFFGFDGTMSGETYTFSQIFTEYYKTPTNLIDENIRWVNTIVDMMIPQRATLFGWAMLLPVFTLLYRAVFRDKKREFIPAAILTGGLPMIHTHSFMVVGLTSAVWLLYCLITPQRGDEVIPKGKKLPTEKRYPWGIIAPIGLILMTILWNVNEKWPLSEGTLVLLYALPVGAVLLFGIYALIRAFGTSEGKTTLLYWGIFAGIALLLALPQLFTWTFRQVSENSLFRPHFNWANQEDGWNHENQYIWFYLKNIGIPAVLAFFGILTASRKKFYFVAPALFIWATAEFFTFQVNLYDNNKLLYGAYILLALLAADFIVDFGRKHIRKVSARKALSVLLVFFISISAWLSMGREYISEYEVYGKEQLDSCYFIEENTPPESIILTDNRTTNAIPSLTGRAIVCGTGTLLNPHGFGSELSRRQNDVRMMYQNPAGSMELFQEYGVDYIYVSAWERESYGVNEAELSRLFPCVYRSGNTQIYEVK